MRRSASGRDGSSERRTKEICKQGSSGLVEPSTPPAPPQNRRPLHRRLETASAGLGNRRPSAILTLMVWKRAIVSSLNNACLLVDEVAYRPAVVWLTRPLPRWWQCELGRLAVWLSAPSDPGLPLPASVVRRHGEETVCRQNQMVPRGSASLVARNRAAAAIPPEGQVHLAKPQGKLLSAKQVVQRLRDEHRS